MSPELWEYERRIPGDPYGGVWRAGVEREGDGGLVLAVYSEEEGGMWATASVDRAAAFQLIDALVAWREAQESPSTRPPA